MTTAEGYLTVTVDDLEQVKFERVRALELDHARTVLLCREMLGTPDEKGPFAQLAEIERRIAVHTAPPPEQEQERGGDHRVDEPGESAESDLDNPSGGLASNETVTTDPVVKG